jgi:Anti-repressor SinI
LKSNQETQILHLYYCHFLTTFFKQLVYNQFELGHLSHPSDKGKHFRKIWAQSHGSKAIAKIAGLPEHHAYLEGNLMEKKTTLDREWILLMKEAKENGITKEEIMDFLRDPQIITIDRSFSPEKLVIK